MNTEQPTNCGQNATGKKDTSITDSDKLAGLTLEQLRDQYRYDLFEDFLPFMDKFIIDHEFGGFMCETDRDGTHISTHKNSWYIGRGIWVYSHLYKELAQEEKYLETARKAMDFILADQPAGNNLWHAEYTKQGKAIEEKGMFGAGGKYISVGREVFGDLFIANGLAEYGRVTANERYWDIAREILTKCMAIYDQPDYAPAAPKVCTDVDMPDMPGARLFGVWMVLLRLCSQMLDYKHDDYVLAVLDRCLDAIFNYHYNPEYDLLNEVLNHDMSRCDNEYRNMVYTGHVIEAMWMVMYEGRRRKDMDLFDKAAQMFKRHIEVAWDAVYGGFYRCLKNVDENAWILDKAGWLQGEVLIGTLFVIEHTGDQWAKDWFAKTFNYVHDKLTLKKHGFSLWDSWPDRKATFVEHYPRIENFHHPRHLMLALQSIERMIQRDQKTSGHT